MLRKIPLQNEHYFHIYNRGVDKRDVFITREDYIKFLVNLRLLNNSLTDGQRDFYKRKKREERLMMSDFGYPKSDIISSPKSDIISFLDFFEEADLLPLVEIISFCLLPNHYHLIIKQCIEGGITKFMRKLGTSYTKFFNYKNERSGYLFQSKFKSAHIRNTDKLCWLSSYVNGNAEIHGITRADQWVWGSYLDYTGKRHGDLCNKGEVLKYFENVNEYIKYSDNVIREVREERKEMITNEFN